MKTVRPEIQEHDLRPYDSSCDPKPLPTAWTRSQPTADCPYRYSSEYVVKQQGKASADKCAAPFQCHDSVLENEYSVMSCRGPLQETGYYFGLPVKTFVGLNCDNGPISAAA